MEKMAFLQKELHETDVLLAKNDQMIQEAQETLNRIDSNAEKISSEVSTLTTRVQKISNSSECLKRIVALIVGLVIALAIGLLMNISVIYLPIFAIFGGGVAFAIKVSMEA